MSQQPPPYYDPKAAPPPQGGYPQAQPYPQGGYPPPQPGMVPPGQTTVVVTGAPLPIFRDQPVRLKCGHCQADIVTSLTYESGALCWIICGVLLLFGLWLGCCLIPFCIDGCKDVIHTCPNCQQTVGKFSRL